MTIIIDSRRAGAGKTTQGIYPRIRMARALDQRILLVVPSKHLQQQYQKEFPNITLINTDTNPKQVIASVYDALTRRKSLVCITSQAWLMTNIDTAIRQDYHLILDESIEPWALEQVTLEDPNVVISLEQVFALDHTRPSNWNLLVRSTSTDSSLFGDQWQRLMNANFRIWTKWDSWTKFMDPACTRRRVDLVRELVPTVFDSWSSVWIAAAAFEYTTLYMWLDIHNIPRQTQYAFESHARAPILWAPEEFRWSQRKRVSKPNIISDLYTHIALVTGNEPCLIVRNNMEQQSMQGELAQNIQLDTYANRKLSHNAHGINDFRHYHNICLATAINPTPVYNDFLKTRVESSNMGWRWDAREYRRWLTRAYVAYNFYQLIMRTSLRMETSTQPVQVFVLDTDVAIALQDFFDFDMTHLKLLVINGAHDAKKIPMTNAEKQKKYRDKKGVTKGL